MCTQMKALFARHKLNYTGLAGSDENSFNFIHSNKLNIQLVVRNFSTIEQYMIDATFRKWAIIRYVIVYGTSRRLILFRRNLDCLTKQYRFTKILTIFYH